MVWFWILLITNESIIMCYAIPGRIEAIKGNRVIVDYFGEKKEAINELKDLSIGDYIYAQGGYVIEKVPSDYALSVLDLWRESFFNLQKLDMSLSSSVLPRDGVDEKLINILDRLIYGGSASRKDIGYILTISDKKSLDYIYKTANFLRQKHLKNSCCVHGIIEISNQCSCACAYCGISSLNQGLRRYKMSVEEAVKVAVDAIDRYGFKALVLQSGEPADKDEFIEYCEAIIQGIRAHKAVFLCISFGEIGLRGLERLYKAGARGMLMRFETSNENLYSRLHPNKMLASRLEHIRYAIELGYLVFTGALIGLPGQTIEDIVEDIFLVRELNAEMYSFGPFIPHEASLLSKASPPDRDMVLKVLAALRFVDYKDARILVTTAFETLDPEARRRGLLAGANSVMLNITPLEYRRLYDIYPDRAWSETGVEEQIESTLTLLQSLGRAPTDLGVR